MLALDLAGRRATITARLVTVENDPLMLVNLAVAPVDHRKVETTLADLAAILAPTSLARGA